MTDIEAHITGTVWKIECAVGDTVEEGDTVAILESMKMEMPVEAEDAGTVSQIVVEEGQAVSEGDTLVVLGLGLRGAMAGPAATPPHEQLADGKLLIDQPAPGVVRLTISNPDKRNALDHPILDAITATLARLAAAGLRAPGA